MEKEKKQEIAKNIGKKIFELRKSHNLSREKFAEICDVSPQHVYYMEKGEFLPGCITLINISNHFSITPSELLIDSLDINEDVLNESVKKDFSKLSNSEKKYIQQLLKTAINLFLSS